MNLITPTGRSCRYRYNHTLLSRVKGYLKYGKVYEATVIDDWYYLPILDAYSHKSVVKEIDILKPKPPVYISQHNPKADRYVNDCGEACCAMHLNGRGFKIDIREIIVSEKTGLTNAGDLYNILLSRGIYSVIAHDLDSYSIESEVPRYSIMLIDHDKIRSYAQDTSYGGWHWVIYVGTDKEQPDMSIVLDPNYWGSRMGEGDHKRYPTAALRSAFRPYNGRYTTKLIFPDLKTA